MKAVSFLSIAFMAASAVAAPFKAETRAVDSVVKDVAGGVVGNTVNTVTEVVKEKRDITDAASLISTLKGVQSSLSDPLSALRTYSI
jgi:hypothetical protein